MKTLIVAGILLICLCSTDEISVSSTVSLTPISETVSLIGKTWLYDRTINLPGLQSIWGDSLTDLPHILSEFAKHFPESPADFHDYPEFLQIVTREYEMIPGWIDCDLRIVSGKTSRGPPFRFGNSVIRNNLMKSLYK